jgi:hypothetical protein
MFRGNKILCKIRLGFASPDQGSCSIDWSENMRVALMFSVILIGIGGTSVSGQQSGRLSVLVNGISVPTYYHNGTTYLEAIQGREYAIRIVNPIGARVAVALSVDGLNSIDARHTDAKSARKWVLEPYESIVISGWQTNASQARRFFFTTEDRSYGVCLGKTENLGIISAVFFREKIVPMPITEPPRVMPAPPGKAPAAQKESSSADAAGASSKAKGEGDVRAESTAPSADYAATGIGNRIRHEVQVVRMDLEDQPFAAVNLRYEYRPILVRLGVLPPSGTYYPLARRERAKGFDDGNYCPEP